MATQHDGLFQTAKNAILANSTKISEEAIDTPGTSANAFCNALASVGDEVLWQHAAKYAELFFLTARGPALFALGLDHYGIAVDDATPSIGQVTFTRTATVNPITIPAGTEVRAAGGVVFVTLQSAAMAVGVATVNVEVESTAAGIDQNVSAGAITAITSGLAQTDITVTNAEATAGGNAAETEDEYRKRLADAFATAARGTLSAIAAGARTVAGVREADAFDGLGAEGEPVGWCRLTISDATGLGNATLVSAVEAVMDEYRAAGVQVSVIAGNPVYEPISYTLIWKSGQATLENRALVKQRILGAVNSLDPNSATSALLAPAGSWLTKGVIEAAARGHAGLLDIEVTVPAGTVKPAPGTVIRTTAALITDE